MESNNVGSNLILTGAHSFREIFEKYKVALKQIQDLALAIFGKKIHILTEREEAEFIYRGAIYKLSDENKLNLVIDIGGGSTEIIIGRAQKVLFVQSLPVGCVGLNQLAEQNINSKNFGDVFFENIYKEVKNHMAPYLDDIKVLLNKPSFRLMGCSGVIRQVFSILNFKSENKFKINKASYKDFKKIKDMITKTLKIDETNKLVYTDITGLREDRVEIFPAGLAVLCALFEILGFNIANQGKEDVCLEVSCGGLREGLLAIPLL